MITLRNVRVSGYCVRALAVLAGSGGLAAFAPLAQAIVYNAATDFSAINNPNGVWSFGYQLPTLGSGFSLETLNGTTGEGFEYWLAGTGGGNLPGAFHNPSASAVITSTGVVEAGQLVLHPGQFGEYQLARFTAPVTGWYQFSASFIGLDSVFSTTTDVHLLANDVSVFDDEVNGFHDLKSSGTFVQSLIAGQTIDAAVGFGSNGTFDGDATGVDFTVELVPSSGAGVLLGLGGLCALRRRRH